MTLLPHGVFGHLVEALTDRYLRPELLADHQAFYGIVIAMFFNDHDPPHFHARYAEYRARIAMPRAIRSTASCPRAPLGL
jgi:hypothetical protein